MERMAKALKHAGISTEDAARELHVSVGTVRNYLSGRTHIPYPAMLLWSRITDVDADWLMGDDYDPRSPHDR
jgi:transcriptional regulator with XRE-family HTH domain